MRNPIQCWSPQNPHSLLCVFAAQKTERAPKVTLIQMSHFLEPTLSPVQLPHEERKTLQGGSPTQTGSTAPERDPGLSEMER